MPSTLKEVKKENDYICNTKNFVFKARFSFWQQTKKHRIKKVQRKFTIEQNRKNYRSLFCTTKKEGEKKHQIENAALYFC